jgi:hypothetical protein
MRLISIRITHYTTYQMLRSYILLFPGLARLELYFWSIDPKSNRHFFFFPAYYLSGMKFIHEELEPISKSVFAYSLSLTRKYHPSP